MAGGLGSLWKGRFQLVQGSGKATEVRLEVSGHQVLRHENIYVKYWATTWAARRRRSAR
jgi:hypothetical protein